MKNTFVLFGILFLILNTSCSIIDMKGFSSGYKNLSEGERSAVIDKTGQPLSTLSNDGNVYLVTASDLLHEMKRHKKTLLYIWSPECKSPGDNLLLKMESYCRSNDITLVIIQEYFSFKSIPDQNQLSAPIYGINTQYYKSDQCSRYTNRFILELTGKEEKEISYSRYFLFEEDKLRQTGNTYIL